MKQEKPKIPDMIYGKMAPQALELESAVLGAALLEPRKLELILPILKAEDFYSDANQRVWASIVRIFISGRINIDFLIVTDDLRKNDELEIIGGSYYVTSLVQNVVSAAHIVEHAMIVKQKALMRECIRICGEGIAAAYENGTDCFDLITRLQLSLSELEAGIRSQAIEHYGDVVVSALSDMAENAKNPSELIGIPTGYKDLDRITLGLTAPDLIIVAGGPGEGKSTYALQMARHMAQANIPVAFFSLEMKNRQLVWKVMSSELDRDIKTIRGGKLSADEWKKTEHIVEKAANTPLYLYDRGGLSIYEFRAICRSLKAKYGIRAVFADYLQLFTTEGGNKNFGLREQEVSFVSRQLKETAMELELPVIALSQLNRMEKGGKRTYKLDDLRESGAIGQDADGVIFIWRPLYHKIVQYKLDNREEIFFNEQDAVILIEKWRLGATGFYRMLFKGYANRFDEWRENLHIPESLKLITKEESNIIQQGSIKYGEEDDVPF